MRWFILLALFSSQVMALSPSQPELAENLDSVVAIRHYAPDHTGDEAPAFCVGVMLAKNILVTAAHCLKDLYFHPQMNLQIDLGHYRYVTRRDTGERVRVGYATSETHQRQVSIKFSPALMRKLASQGKKAKIGPDEDVAVAYLKSELPLKADFVYTRPLSAARFAQFKQNPVGHSPKVISINFMEVASNDIKRSAILNEVKVSGNHLVSKSTARVAPGDSGSPVIIMTPQGPSLAAVVKGQAKTVFSDWDVYTLVQQLICVEERVPGCQ